MTKSFTCHALTNRSVLKGSGSAELFLRILFSDRPVVFASAFVPDYYLLHSCPVLAVNVLEPLETALEACPVVTTIPLVDRRYRSQVRSLNTNYGTRNWTN